MASVRQGTLARASERWQHLRAWGKRLFWSRERKAQERAIIAAYEADSGYDDHRWVCSVCGGSWCECQQPEDGPPCACEECAMSYRNEP